MSSDAGPLWGQIILLAVLIAVNAYFAAAEMAIVSVNKNRIRTIAQEGNRKAEALLKLIDDPNKFLSAIQVVITLAGFLTSAEAAVSFSDDMGVFLESFGIPYGQEISVVIVTLILSFFTLVFGELFPKRLAMLHADAIAMGVVKPILFISAVFKPFVWLLSITVTIMLKICRQRTDVTYVEYSEDDIVSMLEAGQESGELKEEGKKMITGVFAFDDMLAYEVMTPRTDVFSIDINAPTEEYIDELMELRYSRIPVYEDDSDNIIGILYIKDYLIKAREDGFDNVDFRSILRKPYFVPETKKIDSLFFELQTTKQHIAILIDEYGGFSGIVTMEDIIEEVMGDIDDEYDKEEPEIQKIDDMTYVMDGRMDLDDIDEEIGINLESDNSETIGGFIIDILGEIPDENDVGKEIDFENYRFRIDSIRERRIEQITMNIMTPDSGNGDEKDDDRSEEKGD
ncbi:MAG: hemolysin family protein [Lentihominibacter sp.]|nr:hemolysin family protein [Clostridiales bacterium]MDY2679868.1 hemolysin family protein [Lentihominibacter sp.]